MQFTVKLYTVYTDGSGVGYQVRVFIFEKRFLVDGSNQVVDMCTCGHAVLLRLWPCAMMVDDPLFCF